MSEDVELPAVGKVDKRVVAAVGVSAAAFIGYRYWQASRTSSSETVDESTVTSEFDESGDPSTVLGAVRADNGYGIPDTAEPASTDDFGFKGTTNDAWTQYAAAQLSQSDRWTYTDVVEALGNYLAQRPTTPTQQSIVNAAAAVAGQPPQGSHTLVSGGNVPLTVAPTITKVTPSSSSVQISFTPVAGADSYRAYRSDTGTTPVAVSNSSPITVAGLAPNTSYKFTVKGVTAAGTTGPASASTSGKTKTVTLAVPNTPTISGVGSTTATATTGAVSGSTGYDWYLNGKLRAHTDGPSYKLTGLRTKTTYSVSVRADNATQAPTKLSTAKSFTTK